MKERGEEYAKNKCDRCGREIEVKRFIFYEVDQRDGKHRFGIFCI